MRILLAIYLVLFAVLPAFGQQDLETRVKYLEWQVKELTDEVIRLREALQSEQKFTERIWKKVDNKQLYEEAIAPIEKTGNDQSNFFHQLTRSNIWLGGHLELRLQETESREDPNLFDLSRLALSFRSAFNDNITIHGEILFSKEEKVEVQRGYAIVAMSELFNIKAGVIPVPFGRYNRDYSPPSQYLTSIPEINRRMIPTVWSDPGISLFGKLPFSSATIAYEILISNGFGAGGFQRTDGNKEAVQGLRRDNNNEPQWSGRLEIIPRSNIDFFSLRLGMSGIIGRYDQAKKNQFYGIGFDGSLHIGPFTLIGDQDKIILGGEHTLMHIERDQEILHQYPGTVSEMYGHYLEFHYLFFPENWRESFILFGEESSFGISWRYDYVNLDTRSKGASQFDDRQIHTLGIHFYPIEQTVFRLEYSWIRERDIGWAWNNRILTSFATHF